jgi:protoporphyrinogen oxidase
MPEFWQVLSFGISLVLARFDVAGPYHGAGHPLVGDTKMSPRYESFRDSRAQHQSYECCILGAGPAGLGAALELCKHGIHSVVIIDRNHLPGGLARTERFGAARFDIGPHRFFTKNVEINRLWHETLGDDFRPVERMTRILFNHNLFGYPIKASDVVLKLGAVESAKALLSYAHARLAGRVGPVTFEDWVVQKFGRKLYETFFKTYTEKVWGIPCNEIGAEWAEQRIKGLDIVQALRKAVFPESNGRAKSLVDRFHYPVLGAGQMYEVICEQVTALGAKLMLNTSVVGVTRTDDEISSVTVRTPGGGLIDVTASHFFSSIPITHFVKLLAPPESDSVRLAAETLYYRDHITVNLVVDGDDLFPDQWIYVHSPDVRMARIANYNNFSKSMVGESRKTGLSVEYFTFQTEDLWISSDDMLVELAADELDYLGLVRKRTIERAWVVRETESYPTYYLGFQEPYRVLRSCLERFTNLYPIGRGGMYKYNNQDHSTLTGILAARNYLRLSGYPHNIWDVNIDAEYHEEAREQPGKPMVL